MQPVQVPSVVGGADAFIAGDAVGFIFAHGAGKVREADAAVGGLRALPIEETEENLATIREHWPVGFFATMEPGPNAPGVEETSTYFAYPQVIFTHAGVDEETVYQMTKAIYESKEAMAQTFPPFNAFDPADMASDIGVSEFHPGAIRFYKEAGIWTGIVPTGPGTARRAPGCQPCRSATSRPIHRFECA